MFLALWAYSGSSIILPYGRRGNYQILLTSTKFSGCLSVWNDWDDCNLNKSDNLFSKKFYSNIILHEMSRDIICQISLCMYNKYNKILFSESEIQNEQNVSSETEGTNMKR